LIRETKGIGRRGYRREEDCGRGATLPSGARSSRPQPDGPDLWVGLVERALV